MALIRKIKQKLKRETQEAQAAQALGATLRKDTSGVALFMVLSSVSVLAILVSEFTYIAQVSQAIAFGGLDQTKAHYLAKSGLKISLLRLKAYQQIKKFLENMGAATGGAIPGLSKSIIEKIWSFPFFYPIPTNIPGMSSGDKDIITKFQKESNLEGSYSAVIESESRYNINLILKDYVPTPSTTQSSNTGSNSGNSGNSGSSGNNSITPGPSPSPLPPYNPDEARANLSTYIGSLLEHKMKDDPDLAITLRDFRLEDLVDRIVTWADRTYIGRTPLRNDKITMKRAPFYSISELHMLPGMDDELYNIIAPTLTASTTQGININTMTDGTLRALIPTLTVEEIKEFFKYRESEEQDNMFKTPEDFYKYLAKSVGSFRGNTQAITDLKNNLNKRSIVLVTEESQFKITVRAQVNQAVRTIEAWVSLDPQNSQNTGTAGGSGTSNSGAGVQTPLSNMPLAPPKEKSGLRITYMRIL